MKSHLVVLAIGGNSLIRDKNHIALSWQYETLTETVKYMAEGHFKPGSMRPKIEAIIQFLEGGGRKAIITSPKNLMKTMRGERGTAIVN